MATTFSIMATRGLNVEIALTAEQCIRMLINRFLAPPVWCEGFSHEATDIEVDIILGAELYGIPVYVSCCDAAGLLVPNPRIHVRQNWLDA
jgi:hypothetical protein